MTGEICLLFTAWIKQIKMGSILPVYWGQISGWWTAVLTIWQLWLLMQPFDRPITLMLHVVIDEISFLIKPCARYTVLYVDCGRAAGIFTWTPEQILSCLKTHLVNLHDCCFVLQGWNIIVNKIIWIALWGYFAKWFCNKVLSFLNLYYIEYSESYFHFCCQQLPLNTRRKETHVIGLQQSLNYTVFFWINITVTESSRSCWWLKIIIYKHCI